MPPACEQELPAAPEILIVRDVSGEFSTRFGSCCFRPDSSKLDKLWDPSAAGGTRLDVRLH